MPILTFPLSSLPLMLTGEKTCTIRFDQRLARLEVRDSVTLSFGARNKPTVRHARVTRVEVLDFARLANKDGGVIQAMKDSGNVFGEVFSEVLERKRFGEPSVAYAVWLTLEK
jgi:hypothetical protein